MSVDEQSLASLERAAIAYAKSVTRARGADLRATQWIEHRAQRAQQLAAEAKLHKLDCLELLKAAAREFGRGRPSSVTGALNSHGAYICGPCNGGQHLGVHHAGSEHAACQCSCDGIHDQRGLTPESR